MNKHDSSFKILKKRRDKLQSRMNKIEQDRDEKKLQKYKKLVGKYCWKTLYVNSYCRLIEIKCNSYKFLRLDLDYYQDSHNFATASIKMVVEKSDPLFTFEKLTKEITLKQFNSKLHKVKQRLGL